MNKENTGFGDAYQGAREDLAIWKRRALEAEAKVREQDKIIDRLGGALNEENGPVFMGDPAMNRNQTIDSVLISVIANEMNRLGYGLHESHAASILCAIQKAQPQGEPVEVISLSDCVEHHHPEYGSGWFATDNCRRSEQPAPVAAVPSREDLRSVYLSGYSDGQNSPNGYHCEDELNACLDEVARLNAKS